MRKLSERAGRELRWVKGDRDSGGYVLADCWTFKRAGLLPNRTIIRVCDSEEPLATFKNNAYSSIQMRKDAAA